jgi:hypothetical protein
MGIGSGGGGREKDTLLGFQEGSSWGLKGGERGTHALCVGASHVRERSTSPACCFSGRRQRGEKVSVSFVHERNELKEKDLTRRQHCSLYLRI